MRSIAWRVLLVVVAGTASAQNTRSLDPWSARNRIEVLAGRAVGSTVMLATLRRELRSVTVGATLGWLTDSPALYYRNAWGGGWYESWLQSSDQWFVMVGPMVEGAMPFGAFRIESRFSMGLIPRAFGTHRAQNRSRCNYSAGPATCTAPPDSTLFDGSESGRYGAFGLGIRRGGLVVYGSAIWVRGAKQAIQGKRQYWPLALGIRI